MLLDETKLPFVAEPPPRGAGSEGKGRAPWFWKEFLTALLRALAFPAA
jgi:hypothetical protein